MSDCKPCSMPVDTQVKLSEDDGPPVVDATSVVDAMAYRSLTNALQYQTGAGLEGIMGMHLNTHDFCKSMLFYQ
jgi:hypothetical protein